MNSMREEIKCRWGVAKVIEFTTERKAIIIKHPAFPTTAEEIIQSYRQEGYDVIILNTGVKDEAILAEQLLDKYCFKER